MTEREEILYKFLRMAGWQDAQRRPLAGDASARSYERLTLGEREAVLMNAPVETSEVNSGKPSGYSAIAHLAVDCVPFVAIANRLRDWGYSAPEIFAEDTENGFVLLEDLGDRLFARLLKEGDEGVSEETLYGAAVDLLVDLHSRPVPHSLLAPRDGSYELAAYDMAALSIEVDLVVDWFLPAFTGNRVDETTRNSYKQAWQNVLRKLSDLTRESANDVLVLRDYHAENLIWLPERQEHAHIGLLDFQDAVRGSPAYDLVSLLQDARRDVSPELENLMLQRYITAATAARPDFDEAEFRLSYALLGAQRNAKIVGIFMRLWQRDGKPVYLGHLPRVWRYLTSDLEHPALQELRDWFDQSIPAALRTIAPDPDRDVPRRPLGKDGTIAA